MLKKKMIRDILNNKSQFITIFLMIMIGVMVYVGIESYIDGMMKTSNDFYLNNNLQDINVIGRNFTKEDLNNTKKISHIEDVERKLELMALDSKKEDVSYLVSVIESNNISRFKVSSGIGFNPNKKGIWIDHKYAEINNIKVGNKLEFKYDNYLWKEEVLGIVYIPDHVYTIKDPSALVPNYEKFGLIYMSDITIKDYVIEKYIKENKLSITKEELLKKNPNFDYKDLMPFQYLMIDVDDKKNNDVVKNEIETKIKNSLAMIEIEKTPSYMIYQGEIDEGSAFVGIFSGLFLFIAILSVITTMSRVVKKQRIQIGTLKALGFSNRKIVSHYVGYSFWVSLIGMIFGIILGKYFIGNMFYNLEMEFFEVPSKSAYIKSSSYLVSLLMVIIVSIVNLISCKNELLMIPAESLRNDNYTNKEMNLNITTCGFFKKLRFSTKWNIRDILRNKFRTATGVVGIIGCCMLIVCSLGMLDSMNYFIRLQFNELYNFNNKLVIKENTGLKEINKLTNLYGNSTSKTLNIETNNNNARNLSTIFVDNSNDKVRFVDSDQKFIKINSNKGIYVTTKYSETNNLKIGDTIKFHLYGDKKYYSSKIIGYYRDPQVQGFAASKEYIESIGIEYIPDTIYTNKNLKRNGTIENIEVIQNKKELKDSVSKMLSMIKKMISIIIFFAVFLGVIIVYNMGILSFSEKEYHFATLKVLGFDNNKVRNIFVKQNIWISVFSIIIGLPIGYYLTSILFAVCLEENYDFQVYINYYSYFIAAFITFLSTYIISRKISKKICKIDMVSSLKSNE